MDTTERTRLRALCERRSQASTGITMLPRKVQDLLDDADAADRQRGEVVRRVRVALGRMGVADCDDVCDALDSAVDEMERREREAVDEANELRRERDEARAEVERLRVERDRLRREVVAVSAHGARRATGMLRELILLRMAFGAFLRRAGVRRGAVRTVIRGLRGTLLADPEVAAWLRAHRYVSNPTGAYRCDSCGALSMAAMVDGTPHPPAGWVDVGENEHACPTCTRGAP